MRERTESDRKLESGIQDQQPDRCVYLRQEWKERGSYGINGGLIVKWEVTGLDALGSELLIQKFEIAHDGVEMGYPAV